MPIEYPIYSNGAIAGYTLVDEETAQWMKTHKWFLEPNGYVVRKTSVRIPGQKYPIGVKLYLHRIIMGLNFYDELEVDHKDTNPLNNTKSNLKVVTHEENMNNPLTIQTLSRNNTKE